MPKPTEITLSEYRKLADQIPLIQPFSPCCGDILQDMVFLEPLAGRNTLEVDRTCIFKCEKCGRQYVSRWD